MSRVAQIVLVAAILGGAAGAARADETGGQGQLSVAQANRIAAARFGEVKGCYLRHALVEPRASGQVRIDLLVRSDGGVSRARVEAPGIVRRAFGRCVVARAMTWRFPSSSAATEVRMPFRFRIPVRLRSSVGT